MKKIGQKFGKLTIIAESKKIFTGGQNRKAFLCKCDCGNEVVRLSQNLNNKNINNCGCYTKEFAKTIQKKGIKNSCYRHGMFGTKFYNTYYGIKNRCSDTSNKCYGGRGIKCEWNSFEEFKNDMYESYKKHAKGFGEKQTTIDRIDASKNYCNNNCVWATYKEQAKEKRKGYKPPNA